MIKNTGSGDNPLTAVKSPACGMAEVHETVNDAHATQGMNRMPEPVAIPAKGYHSEIGLLTRQIG